MKLPQGISFEECNVENFFHHLCESMNVMLYNWYIDDVDLNYFYFRSGKYSGKEFKDVLNVVSELSFARIRRYPADVQIDCIDEYEDFIKGDCDLLILFYDGGLFEIYGKEEGMISSIMDFCLSSGLENAKYIYDSDDTRSYMHF